MKYNIRGNKVTVTDAIKEYVQTKLGKLDKYFENPEELTANVVIRVDGINQIVEVTIPAKKMILRGEERNKDLYAAIDLVSEKIERQIRKNKTRLKKRKNKGATTPFVVDFETEEIQEDKKIVKRKVIEMKPMNEEEAVLQMELLGHDFFIFKDEGTNEIAILYKRNDNDYGIIETK